MARSKLSGKMLQSDLQRDEDLSIQGGLLYFDVENSRIGVNTVTPKSKFEVDGDISVGQIKVTATGIESSGNISLTTAGIIDAAGSTIGNIADPISKSDAVTRQFLEESIANSTFSITDGSTTDIIDSGDTIGFQGVTNQIKANLANGTLTFALADDIDVVGNLTVNEKLFVDGIDVGNNISGNGNLSIPGEVSGNTFVANSALTLPYLAANALVFTDDTDKLTTYANIRYDGTGAVNVDNVAVIVDNVEITGNSITSSENLNLTAIDGSSVIINNLQVDDNDTPNLIYFVDNQGHATTDSGLSFANSDLTVQGNMFVNGADIGDIGINNNVLSSNSNLILSAEENSFVLVDNTTGFTVPIGTTAERPVNADAGTVRWNSDANYLEVYDGSEWEALGTEVTFITSQIINGDDSTTVFTLDQEATTSGILVYINGVAQTPGASYTVISDQITFVEAPQDQDTVEIRFISLSQTVSALTDESGQSAIRVTEDNTVAFVIENTEVGNISNSAINFSTDTPVKVGNKKLGFLESPQRTISSDTTLVESDRGGHLYVDTVGPYSITIPSQSSVPFPVGTQVAIISHSPNAISVSPETGVEMYLAGNSVSASRTIESYGRAELLKVRNDVWSISGTSII